MKKKTLMLFAVSCMLFWGCKKEGPAGLNSLVDVIPEPKGANCTAGGLKVNTGLDKNRNNILDSDEVQDTRYICNGNDGPAGINSLVDVIPEPKGANCTAGGSKVNIGLDKNKNNILDSDEIQDTRYICNGNDGDYDKQVTIYFPANGYGYATSTVNGNIYPIQNLYNFDVSKYINADSIAFSVYLKVEPQNADPNAFCVVDLYDVTNNKVINNTTLSSNVVSSISPEWKSTTVNFLKELPGSPITLNVRIKSSHEGTTVAYYLPMLTIYRKK